MSPRAAWRLESLGFSQVFDYVAGEADWSASGLPLEGKDAAVPRAGDAARRDVPTCGPADRLGAVRDRVHGAGWDSCVVVNPERIVLGRLRGDRFDGPADAPVERVMEPGPTTIRPDTRLADIGERMRERNTGSVLVTTLDGRLVGALLRADAERRLAESP